MAKICCEVNKCEYNSDGGCRLGNVKVDGENAKVSSETVCKSFTEKHAGASNSCGCACGSTAVECDAAACRHNSDCRCTADRITVGESSACGCGMTECKTFSAK